MEDLKLIYYDSETSVKCPIGNNKANPMWRANKVVSAASMLHGEPSAALTSASDLMSNFLVVGHNIKFDLLYLYRDRIERLPSLWCTQLAEYVLTGQQAKYSSLNDLIKKYVGEYALKDDRLKEWWDAGKDTEDIPSSILEPYLLNDVEVLRPIFEAQWKLAESTGMLPLLLAMMDGLRATICMNLAGMKVDVHYINNQKRYYATLIEMGIEKLKEHTPLGEDSKWASPKEVSLYFFGGEVKRKEKVQDGFYKNGNPRYRTVEVVEQVPGKYVPNEPIGKSGYYSVDDEILSKLVSGGNVVASYILTLRKYTKYLTTYYEGISDLVFPGDFVYPQINHTATHTSRLSCTQPNLQNQTTDGGVKKAFISRWGNDGMLVELDYNQLEVVWLAYLSGDEQLIYDINHSIDVHTALYRDMYGRSPTKEERKAFKPRTFQLIYGAGPNAIAQQSGISVKEARQFIDVFYKRYTKVKEWHNKLVTTANLECSTYYKEDEPGPHHLYMQRMPWGRKYTYRSYKNEWSKDRTFSPTELKNYPVQGSATGDMVPLMLGVLERKLEYAGYGYGTQAMLINTVHDSILLDCHKDVAYNVAKLCKEVLEDAPHYLKEMLNIDFPCKLKVGVEVGTNWLETKEIDV